MRRLSSTAGKSSLANGLSLRLYLAIPNCVGISVFNSVSHHLVSRRREREVIEKEREVMEREGGDGEREVMEREGGDGEREVMERGR